MDEYATRAARDVLAERFRQAAEYGLSFEHQDRSRDPGELARAAAYYAADEDLRRQLAATTIQAAPFGDEGMTPADRRAELVLACALILAEIERLDRVAENADGT